MSGGVARRRDGGAARGCATATATVKFEVDTTDTNLLLDFALLSELARSRRSAMLADLHACAERSASTART
eukprot:scaffold71726_cov42-Phaeocystis_antarctica.AAC.3